MSKSPFGRPAADIQTAYREQVDASPVLTRCALCNWTFAGTAIEGRARALEHRTGRHPDAKQTRRRRGHLQRWTDGDNDWRAEGLQQAAEVAAMHAKRANAT